MKASSGVPPKLQTHPEDRGVARGGYYRGGWRGWSLHRPTGVSLWGHAVLLVQEMGEKRGGRPWAEGQRPSFILCPGP